MKNRRVGRCCGNTILGTLKISFNPRLSFAHSNTRTFARLLGPCFKTGDMVRFFVEQLLDASACPRVGLVIGQQRTGFQSATAPPPVTPGAAPLCGLGLFFSQLARGPLRMRRLITVPGWRTPPGPTSPATQSGPLKQVKLSGLPWVYSVARAPRFGTSCGNLSRAQAQPQTQAPSPPPYPFCISNFGHFSLSFQSSFHLSFTVLVCYWSLTQYLALPEIYPAFRASLPRSTTLWKNSVPLRRPHGHRAVTFSGSAFQRKLPWRKTRADQPSLLETTIRRLTANFKFELFPLHSPLLGKS